MCPALLTWRSAIEASLPDDAGMRLKHSAVNGQRNRS